MIRGEGRAVHLVGQERRRVHSLLQRDGASKMGIRPYAFTVTRVSTVENNCSCPSLDTSLLEQRFQRHTRPNGGAHASSARKVSGALQSEGPASRRHQQEVGIRKLKRLGHHAADLQIPARFTDRRSPKVVTDKKVNVRSHHPFYGFIRAGCVKTGAECGTSAERTQLASQVTRSQATRGDGRQHEFTPPNYPCSTVFVCVN